MKTASLYQIKNTIPLIRDAGDSFYANQNSELVRHFRNAMLMFRTRVELLSSLNHTSTEAETDSMEAMLEVLIQTKYTLQSPITRNTDSNKI